MKTQLKNIIANYLSTLDDQEEQERYCTDKERSEAVLTEFLQYLSKNRISITVEKK